eukprot:m.100225 g.100225  ORF g.100225 m.100225 type:complete len:191 (+) comp37085_c0_seq11:5030-5602(+)
MLKDLSCSLPGSAEPQLSQRKDLIKSMAERKDVVMSSMSTDDDEEEEDEKPRTVHANKPEEHEEDDYDGNEITTSRYTWYTFLPVNLFIQFQRAANAYFLVLLILQLIPVISSLNPISTVVPLVLVLSATGVKDAYDDIVLHFVVDAFCTFNELVPLCVVFRSGTEVTGRLIREKLKCWVVQRCNGKKCV